MKNTVKMIAVSSLIPSAIWAGGIERGTQSVNFLFEEGNFAEFRLVLANPSVSGSVDGTPLASGNMAPSYEEFSLSYKHQLTDRVALGLVIDQPVGADVAYPVATGYPLAGATASIESTGVTGYVKYRFPSNFSLIGGVKYQKTKGTVGDLPVGPAVYSLETERNEAWGYILGAAYERPDIALRVALTYHSAITHDFARVTETVNGANPFGVTSFSSEVPETWNLEFQSGVAENTLVFGSVKWREWSKFDIAPSGFANITGGTSLVDLDSNTTTYQLGVAYRFNEQWAGLVSVTHEEGSGGFSGNLAPTDGFTAVGLGAIYTKDKIRISGGVEYREIGDTPTRIGPATTTFEGNSAVTAGLRVAYSF